MGMTENTPIFPHENKICCLEKTLEIKWLILICCLDPNFLYKYLQ